MSCTIYLVDTYTPIKEMLQASDESQKKALKVKIAAGVIFDMISLTVFIIGAMAINNVGFSASLGSYGYIIIAAAIIADIAAPIILSKSIEAHRQSLAHHSI